ncbi:hypothetical protein GUJ93_ZPchr0002g24683 [Zizania palustris]|uniref:Uncharacterized protein n=1 Tax=Zizania palustris TaxID=103762 RepID=A0A8J5VVI3_ZIZPA|nr:hypothetical protein GUJ93_ZPchr0002g24683 [Zizania palustris]
MGLSFSVFNMFGLPRIGTITSGHVYDRHFKTSRTDSFPEFHLVFVEFCKYFNTVLPGQDFDTPALDQIKKFYDETWEPLKENHDKKKEELMKYLHAYVKEATVDDSLFIMAGLAAPVAAIIVKKTGESIAPVKKFRLDMVPNVLFVPLCTLAAIMGVTAVQMKGKAKAT